jgi:hypothetical protein
MVWPRINIFYISDKHEIYIGNLNSGGLPFQDVYFRAIGSGPQGQFPGLFRKFDTFFIAPRLQ